jgi:subunit length determinant Wzz-like protein
MTDKNKAPNKTPNPPPTPASEPLLDLQRLVIAIRRRRRVWLSAGLLGLIAGAVLAILMPAKPSAVTRLLIVHEQDQPSDTGTLMRTDIALLQTTKIAKAALDKLGAHDRPEDFVNDYKGTGLTSNVLELTVTASTNQDAIARAKALAEVFVADHIARVQAGATAEAKALADQRDRTADELAKVDATIAKTPTDPKAGHAAELQSLYARRAELASQVSDLGRRAEEAGIGAPRVAAGTQIVDAPRAVPGSLAKTGITNAGIGFVLGLALGLTWAAVTGVVRDKPVLRREIAAHLGASVIAQLPARRRGPAKLWRASRGVGERKRVAATLVHAVRDDFGTVSLLELGCPKIAAELTMDMAEELAAEGPVMVVDDLPDQLLAGRPEVPEGPIRIMGGDAMPMPVWPWERHIGVGSVEPGAAWTDLERLGSETVLVVRAGYADTAWLHTVARQLADIKVPIIGVVLVDSDPRDRSDGTLWDGLHTALRGRSVRTDRPRPDVLTPRSGDPSGLGAVVRLGERATERFAPVEKPGKPGKPSPANGDASHPVDLPTTKFAPARQLKPEQGEVS